MPTPDLTATAIDDAFWPRWAQAVRAVLAADAPLAADAVVLLPQAQLLPQARAALAAPGQWLPRVETTQTLAQALGPPPVRAAGAPSGDAAIDRLLAAELLRGVAGGDWARSDPQGFGHAVESFVDAAQQLGQAAAARAPAARAGWWPQARERLAAGAGPGPLERALALAALEWAALDDTAPTDRLHALRPAAWVVTEGVGVDALGQALLRQGDVPGFGLRLAAPDVEQGWAAAARLPPPRLLVLDGFEDEAEAAAAEVLAALQRGCAPVALVALDRALVRRVHALLGRVAGLRVHDETGWKLSTTRAAARVMALLRAAAPDADADARLDALKAEPTLAPATVAALEAAWRSGRAAPAAVEADPALQAWHQRLQPLAAAGRQPLAQWLRALASALGPVPEDPAAQQLAVVLRLDDEAAAAQSPHWRALARRSLLGRGEFVAWVDAALEGASFYPPAPVQPQVVITALAHALWRPFGAVVCPGCDGRRLGAAEAAPVWWGDEVAAAIGLETRAQRREREARAFAQLLRAPGLALLHRRNDDGEPLGASLLLERAARARRRAGAAGFVAATAPLRWQPVVARPPQRPAPRWPGALPTRLSAHAVEALRDCPYRFHARSGLGLREAEELDDAVEKRDYGNWLHALLLRFHRERPAPRPPAADIAALAALADAVAAEQRLDPALLLPYRAAFDALAPRYADWLQGRDAAGWRWQAGEVERERAADARLPLRLHGRIDRIDAGRGGALALIDYKTVRAERLRKAVRQPLEDTQLAVYALLLGAADGDDDDDNGDDSRAADAADAPAPPLQASYLALDERDAPIAVEHPEVVRTARGFLAGLAADLRELAAGAGLPALGEGEVCAHCEVRGLCRRDHWAEPAAAAPGAAPGDPPDAAPAAAPAAPR
jgi:ATP-dependent helicase/nuclease subunit B